jgi:hypothetical protein
MPNRNIFRVLQERFGDPIGDYAGDAPAGVRIDSQVRCPVCGTGDCECQNSMSEGEICGECGMMEVEGACGCTHEIEEAKKKRGLWANIHARRKAGKRPKKPGEKGYPKTLDI